MQARILRGVRVATPQGIRPASVHIQGGTIAALAEYEDIPRMARPEELGKAVLMPGLVQYLPRKRDEKDTQAAAAGGITTGLHHELGSLGWIDQAQVTSTEDAPPNLALFLAAFWTDARNRGRSIESVVEELAQAPALRAGLAERKGHIAVGCDADLVIWHPELTLVGTAPPLYGAIRQTILRGQTIFKDGQLVGEPSGRWIAPEKLSD